MNSTNGKDPINILLSRHELQVVLDLLQAESLPGLDADPLGQLSANEQALALSVARYALQARELVQVQDNDRWIVHNTLLTAVGVCAYSQSTVFVYHWPAKTEIPIRYFGHIRPDGVVAHTRPDDVLHLFSVLPSKQYLFEQLLQVCNYKDVPDSLPDEMSVSPDTFVAVRELSSAGKTEKAVKMLVKNTTVGKTAQAFVETLAGLPKVSIIQTLTYKEGEPVRKRDFTLLQNSQFAWLISASTDEQESSLTVKSTSRREIQALLAAWL